MSSILRSPLGLQSTKFCEVAGASIDVLRDAAGVALRHLPDVVANQAQVSGAMWTRRAWARRIVALSDHLGEIDASAWKEESDVRMDLSRDDWEAVRVVAQVALGHLKEMEEVSGEPETCDIARMLLAMWDAADAGLLPSGGA